MVPGGGETVRDSLRHVIHSERSRPLRNETRFQAIERALKSPE